MKYRRSIAAVVAASGLLWSAIPAAADPTDSGVANNPGLQQACAFNPAFNRAHAKACEGISVETVASNGTDESAAVAAHIPH